MSNRSYALKASAQPKFLSSLIEARIQFILLRHTTQNRSIKFESLHSECGNREWWKERFPCSKQGVLLLSKPQRPPSVPFSCRPIRLLYNAVAEVVGALVSRSWHCVPGSNLGQSHECWIFFLLSAFWTLYRRRSREWYVTGGCRSSRASVWVSSSLLRSMR